jgi:transcriptional antiterminator NusG
MHTELIVPRFSPPVSSLNWGVGLPWYGVRTRSNHERIAAMVLSGKGYESYLPLYSIRRRGTNHTPAKTELPLFPGYLFCRFDVKKRLPILMTTGVLSVLGSGNEPLAIPEEEIEKVKAILRSGLAAQPCANLKEGQRVRVTDGSLAGVEGILVKKKSQSRMVISVGTLQRSISVEIDGVRLAAI